MSEPFYVTQTFDPEHVANLETQENWFQHHRSQALAAGATYFRYSHHSDLTGLLIEAWREKPTDEGAPRWSLVASGPDAEK